MREFFRPKSVNSIEADDHFKEADAKTKHIIYGTRGKIPFVAILWNGNGLRIEEKKQLKAEILNRRIVTLSSLKLTQLETNLLEKG